LAIAAKRNPRLKLIVAGEGNLSDMINQYRSARGLSRDLFMAGFRSDIPAFMKGIDFLAMPSYWEGFGYTAVEAMAAGKAVVGTWASSLPEIIENGCTGIMVPPRSAEDLAEALLRISLDSKLSESMGKEGFARVSKLFQLNSMIEKTESFIERIVKDYSTRINT
jgi:glycosyltransferase involved in cell wall biosynthesis